MFLLLWFWFWLWLLLICISNSALSFDKILLHPQLDSLVTETLDSLLLCIVRFVVLHRPGAFFGGYAVDDSHFASSLKAEIYSTTKNPMMHTIHGFLGEVILDHPSKGDVFGETQVALQAEVAFQTSTFVQVLLWLDLLRANFPVSKIRWWCPRGQIQGNNFTSPWPMVPGFR